MRAIVQGYADSTCMRTQMRGRGSTVVGYLTEAGDGTCMGTGQLVVSPVTRACRLDVSAGWSRVAWVMNSRGRQMCALLSCIPGLVRSWDCFDGWRDQLAWWRLELECQQEAYRVAEIGKGRAWVDSLGVHGGHADFIQYASWLASGRDRRAGKKGRAAAYECMPYAWVGVERARLEGPCDLGKRNRPIGLSVCEAWGVGIRWAARVWSVGTGFGLFRAWAWACSWAENLPTFELKMGL